MKSKALAIDLFCGLGGWTEALMAEGYYVVGFDIEAHQYGRQRYPAQLVLQDVLTLHGAQFKDAALIVASPPCVEYSYMAMPWKRAKQIAAALRGAGTFPEGYRGSRTVEELNALFNACFRIQREAREASGREIPLIVENVRGAIPWVGRSRWNYGSFYLWGDVPALMPPTLGGHKVPSFRLDGSVRRSAIGNGARFTSRDCGLERAEGRKTVGMNWSDRTKRGQDFTRIAGLQAEGIKCGGDWFNADAPSISRMCSSKSPARKAASAMIAKIPYPLAKHIAATFKPAHSEGIAA